MILGALFVAGKLHVVHYTMFGRCLAPNVYRIGEGTRHVMTSAAHVL